MRVSGLMMTSDVVVWTPSMNTPEHDTVTEERMGLILLFRVRARENPSPHSKNLVMSVAKVNEVTHLPALVPGRSLATMATVNGKVKLLFRFGLQKNVGRCDSWESQQDVLRLRRTWLDSSHSLRYSLKLPALVVETGWWARKLNYLVLMGFSIWLRAGRE